MLSTNQIAAQEIKTGVLEYGKLCERGLVNTILSEIIYLFRDCENSYFTNRTSGRSIRK